MLLKTGVVIRPCPVGGNFAEKISRGTVTVTMANGSQRRDPVYTGKYVEGLPFGYIQETKAPIALEIDDEVYITEETGDVYKIIRSEKVVWSNAAIVAEEKAKAEASRDKWKR